MLTRRMSVGAAGESVAGRFLERRGAVIVDRNVRVGQDEIDLIVRIDGRPVAVEVKTGLGPGTRPWENFDDEKNARIRRAAGVLSIRRIDLIAVELNGFGATVRWLPGVG
ncbi:MAG: YraN family protein [Actinomycetota bacterium]|nr:YraN family protein [Actinomycetota bacterium]